MTKFTSILFLLIIFVSCENENSSPSTSDSKELDFISAADISSFPEISNTNAAFYDLNRNQNDFLALLKSQGVNTIRLRIWVDPKNEHSSFLEVKQFSQTLKSKGFQIWITVHYSDTWADPSQQKTPKDWLHYSFSELKEEVFHYTEKIIQEINPDYIQIGNEINNGFLHPFGHIYNNHQQFLELLDTGILAVRKTSSTTKIILHYAGIKGSDWFFNQIKDLDYDIIGLSYYPIWHGKDLNELKNNLELLSTQHRKDILIAETAYPFRLDWNDWTNNIVGLEEHLILPDYPATEDGQKNFIRKIKEIVKETKNGLGFCYWGAELIAWNGNKSQEGSSWENQALFDFSNQALPVLEEFHIN